MSPVDDLESAAMALPRAERARLAQRLLASLDEDTEVEAAWRSEVRRRLEEYDAGQIQPLPADQVFSEARRRTRKQ